MVKVFSKISLMVIVVLAMLMPLSIAGQASAQELVMYSGRIERLIRPILDDFTKETGIKVKLHSGATVELLNRLLAEGDRTPADLYLTVDAGTLERARIAGLLHPIKSDVIEKNVPAEMRAVDNSWVGLSLRTRVIAYNPEKVKPAEIKTFDDLTHPKFKGRLGVRTGTNVYPQSHAAMMMVERGEAATEIFLRAIVANAGDRIYPSDTRAVEGVAKREVDVAIVNHYYVYGHLKRNPGDSKTLAYVVPPRTAYNVSGIGILRTSKNKEAAQRLIEFLATKGQALFAEKNREYPVNPKIPAHETMLPRDRFTVSPVSLAIMGRYMVPAMDLIDKAGYK
ncbi:MAG TPA: iron ABC transporter substrate-binding protein [Nitrospiraceae bacterium]|nr:iron ABC transporter substrate-binding protein [Nitrospiraceae bacterium]